MARGGSKSRVAMAMACDELGWLWSRLGAGPEERGAREMTMMPTRTGAAKLSPSPLPSIWSFLLLRHWPGRALSVFVSASLLSLIRALPSDPLLLSPSMGHQIGGQEQEKNLKGGATLSRRNLQRCVCGWAAAAAPFPVLKMLLAA